MVVLLIRWELVVIAFVKVAGIITIILIVVAVLADVVAHDDSGFVAFALVTDSGAAGTGSFVKDAHMVERSWVQFPLWPFVPYWLDLCQYYCSRSHGLSVWQHLKMSYISLGICLQDSLVPDDECSEIMKPFNSQQQQS